MAVMPVLRNIILFGILIGAGRVAGMDLNSALCSSILRRTMGLNGWSAMPPEHGAAASTYPGRHRDRDNDHRRDGHPQPRPRQPQGAWTTQPSSTRTSPFLPQRAEAFFHNPNSTPGHQSRPFSDCSSGSFVSTLMVKSHTARPLPRPSGPHWPMGRLRPTGFCHHLQVVVSRPRPFLFLQPASAGLAGSPPSPAKAGP